METFIYDIEVMYDDFCVVLKKHNENQYHYYVNDLTGLEEFISDKILVGYNNYFYDDKMLSFMLKNDKKLYKKANDSLILNGLKMKSHLTNTLDVFQELDVSKPGLKQIELNLGANIEEKGDLLMLNRKLTKEELDEVVKYCAYDVEMTEKVYNTKERQNYFQSKKRIVKMFEFPEFFNKFTIPTLNGNAFQNSLKFGKNDLLKLINTFENVPQEIKDYWTCYTNNPLKKVPKYTYKLDNFKYDFGFGGLHGSDKKSVVNTCVYHYDFASLYPSILSKNEFLGEKSEVFAKIKNERVGLKKTDPELSETYKLMLNKTYGALGNQYNNLYNSHLMNAVCFIGQDLLYGICKTLPQHLILNVNTDGVYLRKKIDIPKIEGYIVEETVYKTLIQKDVNNYTTIDLNDKIVGKGFLKNPNGVNYYTQNNDLAIVQKAVIEKLINKTPFIDTILNNMDNPRLYQKTIKHGKTYKYIKDENGTKLQQRINRGFATVDGVSYKKYKVIDGVEYGEHIDTKFKGQIYNGDLDEKSSGWLKNNIDVGYYLAHCERLFKMIK